MRFTHIISLSVIATTAMALPNPSNMEERDAEVWQGTLDERSYDAGYDPSEMKRDAEAAEFALDERDSLEERDDIDEGPPYDLDERDYELDERDYELEERDYELEGRDYELEDGDEDLEYDLWARSVDLDERDFDLEYNLEARNADLEERDADLEERDADFEERDVNLEERDADLEERDAEPEARGIIARDLGSGAVVTASSGANTIRALQWLLNGHGQSVAADGSLGPKTKAAITAFQKKAGLKADGVAGPATLGKLVGTVKSGSKGNTVKAAQAALNGKGASLAVDGSFGPGTKAAAVSFQKSKGLVADGVIGPKTWTALFSGGGSTDPNPPPSTAKGCTGVNTAGLNLIKEFEGFRSHVYTDVAGHATVGYGHLCQRKGCAEVKYKIPLSLASGTKLLQDDIPKYTQCLRTRVRRPLNDNQWAALTSFTFNLGCGTLAKSDLLRRINNGENPNTVASQEIPKYRFAIIKKKKVEVSGLKRRRNAEVKLFTTPSSKQAYPKCT